MIKNIKILFASLLLISSFLLFVNFSFAKNTVDVFFFYSTGCPHCTTMAQALSEVARQNPQQVIPHPLEATSMAGAALLPSLAKSYGISPDSVPIVFVGDRAIVGAGPNQINQLKETVRACLISSCPSPKERIETVEHRNRLDIKWGNLGILIGILSFIFLFISLLKKKK